MSLCTGLPRAFGVLCSPMLIFFVSLCIFKSVREFVCDSLPHHPGLLDELELFSCRTVHASLHAKSIRLKEVKRVTLSPPVISCRLAVFVIPTF